MFSFEKSKDKVSRKQVLLRVFLVLIFVLGVSLAAMSYWFVDYFGSLTPEQFLFIMMSPQTGTSGGSMESILKGPVVVVSIVSFIF
ncbi:MAG: hypothetical protein WBO70_02315, partial [Erysipelotrichaceae bacterium]